MPGRTCLRWMLVCACALAWLIQAAPAAAQDIPPNWQPLGGPGGRITHLAAAPDGAEIYAISVTGVNRRDDQTQWYDTGDVSRADALYRSGDGGATWQPVTNDLPPGPMTALYVDPATGNLYVGMQGSDDASARRSGLWRSVDHGQHWQPVALAAAGAQIGNTLIRRITRSAGGSYLFLGATEAGERPDSIIYRSSNDGQTWTAWRALRYGDQPGNMLAALIPHPSRPDRLFLTSYRGDLLASNDAGQTWRPAVEPAGSAEAGASPAQLVFSPDRPDIALLIRGHSGSDADTLTVTRSTDAGVTWRQVAATGLPARDEPRALVALSNNIFLLTTASGTYRSADGGVTWQPLEGALSNGGVAEFLSFSGPSQTTANLQTQPASGSGGYVLAATGYGIFVSRDGGAVWQPFGSGLPFNSKIAGLLTHPGRPGQIVAVSDNRSLWGTVQPPMILHSLDSGRRWGPAALGLPDAPVTAWTVDANDPSTLFVASWNHVSRSTDAGLTWQVTRLDSSSRKVIAVAPSDSNIVYLGGRPALRSTDRGMTWQPMPVIGAGQEGQTQDITGLVVAPQAADHVWAALDGGVYESRDAGRTWQQAGLTGKTVRWLAASATGEPAQDAPGSVSLYAGVFEDGIYRWEDAQTGWMPASVGLPDRSTVLSLAADPRKPGLLWAARDGGGVYRSTDGGNHWSNAGVGAGENLALALAIDYVAPDSVLMGTATAGVWALRTNTQPTPTPQTPATAPATAANGRAGVDARIELVWPHDWAPVTEARLANLGLRLFIPSSFTLPACGWQPKVTLWQAINTDPAASLAPAEQRSVDGQPFSFWELNDIDVSRAADPTQKLYFMVRVEGVDTATSVWAHGADARTYFPQQDVPSGIAGDPIGEVDARIEIVWPHDEAGNARPVTEGALANVAVAFFQHGTRLSAPVGWQPAGLTLFGAWDQEVGKPLTRQAVAYTRQSGAITYPVWEFHNIPVVRATSPVHSPPETTAEQATGSTLYLWVIADGVQTYPSIWAHGADSRTYFPAKDEPIQGCVP